MRHICLGTSIWIFSALLFVSTTAARAQDSGAAMDMTGMGIYAMEDAIKESAQSAAGAHHHKGTKANTTHKRPVLSGSTRFRSNFAMRKHNLAQFVAKMRAVDPQGAASLQRTFAKGDPIATIAPGLRRYGLRTDDVADAAAAYLVSAWYGVRGRNDDPPLTQVRGVREQMRRVMLLVPAFVSASDAAKQQMAEAMLLQTMIADALVTSAKGKPAQMAKVKAAIGQGARNSFHLDLAKMKLTDSGLRS